VSGWLSILVLFSLICSFCAFSLLFMREGLVGAECLCELGVAMHVWSLWGFCFREQGSFGGIYVGCPEIV